jgi:hypothetical protein
MATNTNQPDGSQPLRGPLEPKLGQRDAAHKKSPPTRVPNRDRRPGFWEKQVDQIGDPTSSAESQEVTTTPDSVPDAPQLSKSIEAVFLSKSAARKRRNREHEPARPYQNETSRPIVCLAFVLPLLVFYEIGSILLAGESLRSGIDQWFHQALSRLGFGELVVLPIVTIAVMIVWHHRNHDHWRIRATVLVGMLLEAIGLGLILFWAASAINLLIGGAMANAISAVAPNAVAPNVAPDQWGRQWWASIVTCVGSGIYEELIFRIIFLIPVIIWARKLVSNARIATIIGVIAVSLLLAAVHYNVFNPAGNQFELSSFVFRFFASIVFCILFLYRGFGIAVGAHVAYDVLTQV